ncbi:MAG: hypothetical protein K2Y21_04090 [Phycisphaerales bacterium]|nr:hypothetical protein [Phycisphaerales bacterium]
MQSFHTIRGFVEESSASASRAWLLRGVAVLALLATLAASCERRATRPAPTTPTTPSAPTAAGTTSAPTATPPAQSSPSVPSQGVSQAPRFVPSQHGFAFRNHFPGLGLPTFLVGTEKRASVPTRGGPAFGLCGGMSAAAADYFLAHRSVPVTSLIPERGSELYEYLYLRQAESIGPGIATAVKIVEWMTRNDGELRTRTKKELESIRAALDARGVAPIGLVLARFGGPPGANTPSDNHQVLAWSVLEEQGKTVLGIYDPNYPGDDAVRIELDWSAPSTGPVGRRIDGRGRETPVRGVIQVPYTPKDPPREPV